MPHLIRTIDAHVGGCPVRLIVGGVAPLTARSLPARVGRLQRQFDHIRGGLLRPQRRALRIGEDDANGNGNGHTNGEDHSETNGG